MPWTPSAIQGQTLFRMATDMAEVDLDCFGHELGFSNQDIRETILPFPDNPQRAILALYFLCIKKYGYSKTFIESILSWYWGEVTKNLRDTLTCPITHCPVKKPAEVTLNNGRVQYFESGELETWLINYKHINPLTKEPLTWADVNKECSKQFKMLEKKLKKAETENDVALLERRAKAGQLYQMIDGSANAENDDDSTSEDADFGRVSNITVVNSTVTTVGVASFHADAGIEQETQGGSFRCPIL